MEEPNLLDLLEVALDEFGNVGVDCLHAQVFQAGEETENGFDALLAIAVEGDDVQELKALQPGAFLS